MSACGCLWRQRFAVDVRDGTTRAGGGEPGVASRAIIAADGFDGRLTEAAHPNAVVIEDCRGDERRVITATDVPRLGRHEADDLYSSTIGAAVSAGVCVLAGSQGTPALPDDVYRRLASDLRNNGVCVVADLSGDLCGRRCVAVLTS